MANVESKKLIVEEIKAKVQESKSIVFADYNKLTVLEVTALRRKFMIWSLQRQFHYKWRHKYV